MATPIYDSVERRTSLSPLLSFEHIPPDIAAAASSVQTPLPSLDRGIALQNLCNEQHREPTADEIASIYDFVPFDANSSRHRAAAAAVARQRATEARRAAGHAEDPPAPRSTRTFSFSEVLGHIEAEAAIRNRELQPGENGVLKKFAPDPAKAAILACRLAGGGTAPTEKEIDACLKPTPFLRTAAGDYAIPSQV